MTAPNTPRARHLVLMAKAPRMGTVKTRLARDIGTVNALAVYRRLLFATAHKLQDPRWTPHLAVTPDATGTEARLWPAGWPRFPQGQGDLGARMLRAMKTLPPGPVVVVGADVPAIRPLHIAHAFKLLGDNDWVFGPAMDGGFWLVGAKRTPRLANPFQSVRWSSEHALDDTLANLPAGTRVGFVETLWDVDGAADLD